MVLLHLNQRERTLLSAPPGLLAFHWLATNPHGGTDKPRRKPQARTLGQVPIQVQHFHQMLRQKTVVHQRGPEGMSLQLVAVPMVAVRLLCVAVPTQGTTSQIVKKARQSRLPDGVPVPLKIRKAVTDPLPTSLLHASWTD